jgi:hypothetical protein
LTRPATRCLLLTKMKAYKLGPDGKLQPIKLSPAEWAAMQKDFSERFNPDFTRKSLTPSSAQIIPRSPARRSRRSSPAASLSTTST